MKDNKLLDEIYNILKQDNIKLTDIWITQIIFRWRWWLSIALAIIPWIVWIKIRNKKDTARLLFTGAVAAIISNMLDIIGACYNLWHYDWKDFPLYLYICLGILPCFLLV
jgi:hypothetical protein